MEGMVTIGVYSRMSLESGRYSFERID